MPAHFAPGGAGQGRCPCRRRRVSEAPSSCCGPDEHRGRPPHRAPSLRAFTRRLRPVGRASAPVINVRGGLGDFLRSGAPLGLFGRRGDFRQGVTSGDGARCAGALGWACGSGQGARAGAGCPATAAAAHALGKPGQIAESLVRQGLPTGRVMKSSLGELAN